MEGGSTGKNIDMFSGIRQFTTKQMIDVSKNIVTRAQNPLKLTFKNINQTVDIIS